MFKFGAFQAGPFQLNYQQVEALSPDIRDGKQPMFGKPRRPQDDEDLLAIAALLVPILARRRP